jgi:spore maturation protein SpmA
MVQNGLTDSGSYHPEIIISLFCAGIVGWLILMSLAKALGLLEQIADQTKPQLAEKPATEQVKADSELCGHPA